MYKGVSSNDVQRRAPESSIPLSKKHVDSIRDTGELTWLLKV